MKKIVHYHIFKAAGSSVIRDLQNSFGNGRVLELDRDERYVNNRPYNLQAIRRAAEENPKVRAFTCHAFTCNTHLAFGQDAFPVIFVRHPLLHAASVYRFERKRTDSHRPDRQLIASNLDFVQWVVYSLDAPNGLDCMNYQTRIMLREPQGAMITAAAIKNAKEHYRYLLENYIQSFPTLGIVEEYKSSIRLLNEELSKAGLDFQFSTDTKTNVTKAVNDWRAEADGLERQLGSELTQRFKTQNELDYYMFELGLDALAAKNGGKSV